MSQKGSTILQKWDISYWRNICKIFVLQKEILTLCGHLYFLQLLKISNNNFCGKIHFYTWLQLPLVMIRYYHGSNKHTRRYDCVTSPVTEKMSVYKYTNMPFFNLWSSSSSILIPKQNTKLALKCLETFCCSKGSYF